MKKMIQKIKALFGYKEVETASTGKVFVHFSDGLCTLADNAHEAQAMVMQRCLQEAEPVFANFYRATPEDAEEFRKIQEGEV